LCPFKQNLIAFERSTKKDNDIIKKKMKQKKVIFF